MADETKKEPSFVIRDRRLFNPDGSIRDSAQLEEESTREATKASTPGQPAAPAAPKREDRAPEAPPSKSSENGFPFSHFILSLASSVQINLGLVPHPATRRSEVNLAAAKQSIDMLSMLEEKTRGNLDEEETSTLKSVLYEMRTQYVEISNQLRQQP